MPWLNRIKDVFGRKPLRELLPGMLDPGDPRVAIRPLGGDWLCPYTGTRVAAPKWNGSSRTLLKCPEIAKYLLNLPLLESARTGARMLAWENLVRLTVALRIMSAPNYKISSDKGEWVCPHCLTNTGVLLHQWDGSETTPELWVPPVLEHLQQCQPYLTDPLGAKPLKEMEQLRGERSAKTELLERVAAEAIFHVSNAKGAFVCPFCQRSVDQINLTKWSPALQELIVEHLLSKECPARYSQWRVTVTAAELQRQALRKQDK